MRIPQFQHFAGSKMLILRSFATFGAVSKARKSAPVTALRRIMPAIEDAFVRHSISSALAEELPHGNMGLGTSGHSGSGEGNSGGLRGEVNANSK